MDKTLLQIKKLCLPLAARIAWSDDKEFMAMDRAGGNIDDAYAGGDRDGETLLARAIMETIPKEDTDAL